MTVGPSLYIMLALLKNLARSSAMYSICLSFQKVMAFLLLPVYTRYLAPDQFGVFALLNTSGQLAGVVLGLGFAGSLVWAVVYREMDEKSTFSTAILFQVSYGLVLTLIFCAAAPVLVTKIFGNSDYTLLLQAMFVAMFFEVAEFTLVARMRIRDRPGLLSALFSARILVGTSLKILFLVPMNMGVQGLVLGQVVTSAIFGTYALFILWPREGVVFSRPVLRDLLTYGAPMVPVGLCGIVLTASDRYFLQYFSGDYEVGLYALGYNIGMVVMVATMSLQMAWIPQMFSIAKGDAEAKVTIGRMLTYYVLLLGVIGLVLSLLAREIIMIMAPDHYHSAARVVPLVVLSYILSGVTLFTNIGMKIHKKLYLMNPVVVGAALLNIVLNYLWIPRYGMMGAAWATLMAYTAQTLAVTLINHRLWSIRYEGGRLVRLTLVFILVYIAGAKWVVVDSLPVTIAGKLVILMFLPVILWAAGFFHRQERVVIARLFRSIAPRS